MARLILEHFSLASKISSLQNLNLSLAASTFPLLFTPASLAARVYIGFPPPASSQPSNQLPAVNY